MALHVSTHAIIRYRERVRPVSYDEARAALSSAVIERAAQFGCEYVRLGTGQRVVIERGCVVTVLPKGWNVGCAAIRRNREH